MTFAKKILLLGFLIGMLTPVINDVFNIFPNRNTEKGKSIKKPLFKIFELNKWIDNYDTYYKSNFSGRSVFFRSISKLKYHLWGTSVLPNKVISGKNDFLFLGNHHAKIIDAQLGLNPLQPHQIKKINLKLNNIKNWCRKNNIQFYLAIAPNKSTIYPELLPFKIDSTVQRPLNQLKENLLFDNLIDLGEGMKSKKKRGLLYYKLDTHWSPLGAYIGYVNLIKKIKNDFLFLEPVIFTDFKREIYKRCNRNICRQIDANICEKRYRLHYKKEKKVRKVKSLYQKKEKNDYEIRYKNPEKKLKVLLYRDSFATELQFFLNKNFKELVLLWTSKLDKKIIKQEKPDILIVEIIERNLNQLLLL